MNAMAEGAPGAVAHRLNELLTEAGLPESGIREAEQFETYLHLLVRWNSRTNLTAIRDPEGILRRHFVESIACARALPPGIGSLLDFGSGAGFPGLPIAVCRPEIAVTLAESQGKKAAFLREAVRTIGIPVAVHSGRAQELDRSFDCVTLRAVDRMEEAVRGGSRLVGSRGWLTLLTTNSESAGLQAAAGGCFAWREVALPAGGSRTLVLGRRASE